MKLVVVIISLLVAVSALTDQEQWTTFKERHGKTYKSLREEQLHFKIFINNLRKIENHNARYEAGLETYEMGVNQFTDLTEEEFSKSLNAVRPTFEPIRGFKRNPNRKTTPKNVDWRTKGAVLEVQDQGNCGNCWAFATTGTLEGQNFIINNQSILLSVQDLNDCGKDYNNGCKGGYANTAIKYVEKFGISADKDYPYKASDMSCIQGIPKVNMKVAGYTIIEQDEDEIQEAVETAGPLAVEIYASLFQSYKGGIFNPVNCWTKTNHVMLLVGFGTQNGTDYWLLKNSWGTTFGEDGYIRLVKNGKNICGLWNLAIYPNITPNKIQ